MHVSPIFVALASLTYVLATPVADAKLNVLERRISCSPGAGSGAVCASLCAAGSSSINCSASTVSGPNMFISHLCVSMEANGYTLVLRKKVHLSLSLLKTWCGCRVGLLVVQAEIAHGYSITALE